VADSNENWTYDRKRRHDKKGGRWHFAAHGLFDPDVPYQEQPFELYFRNDERTEFGVVRFERRKDNPYRDYEAMVTKIMNDADFRRTLLDPDTESVWRRSWK
jgi:hypothetical protein